MSLVRLLVGFTFLVCATATTISKCGNGSTVLTTSNGILTDGGGAFGFPTPVKCAWLIIPEDANNKILKINITMLSLDWADSFAIYDGLSVFQRSPLFSVHKLTGSYQVLYTTGSLATITYQGLSASPGFALSWSVASSCPNPGRQVLTDPTGVIAVDPLGPLCSFLVQPDVPDLSDIVLKFSSFCQGELTIYDGDDSSATVIYSSNSTDHPQLIVGTSKSLFIVTGQVFNITSGICLEMTYYSRACNQTFMSLEDYDEGFFGIGAGVASQLAAGNDTYNSSVVDCTWSLPASQPLLLSFLILDLGPEDSLQIYRLNSDSLLASFDAETGTPAHFPVDTSVVVKYSFLPNVSNPGLLVNYAPLLCYYPKVLTLTNNSLSVGFGDTDAPSEPGLSCLWIFHPTENGTKFIRLSFTVSQFNPGDSIIVYSNQVNYTITTITGDLQLNEMDIEMQPLVIQYTSSTNPGAGWVGEITAIECPTLGLLIGMSATVEFDTSSRESGCSYNISPHVANGTISWIEITFTQIENDLAPVYVRTAEVVYDDAIIRQNTPIMLRASQAIITLPYSPNLGRGSFSYRSGTEPLSCTNEIRSTRAGSILIGDSPLGDGSPTLNANCSWLLLPPHSNHLWILKLRMSQVQDTQVMLYLNGTSETDRDAIVLSVTSPTTVEALADSIFVKWFNSDSGNCSWSLVYLWVPAATASSWVLLDNASGVIQHTGSQQSEELFWVIAPPGTNWVQLSVDFIRTEDSFDTIEIYSGVNETTLMNPDDEISFSGQVALQPLFIPKLAVIKWRADSSVPSAGWKISWETQPLRVGPFFTSAKKEDCQLEGPFRLNSSKGILAVNETTYMSNNYCRWILSLPALSNSSWIKFTVSNLSVEACCDRLTIYQNGTVLQRWTGDVRSDVIFAAPVDGNFKFSIEWFTNGQNTGTGWTLTWELGTKALSQDHITHPASLPLYDGCQSVRSLESYTSTGFTFVLFAPEALIASSSNNGSFSQGYCTWVVKSPGASMYLVQLKTVDIGDDTIFISGGDDEVTQQVSGTTPARSFPIYGDKLVISWTGNGRNVGKGWELQYSQGSSLTGINDGTLDPGIIFGIVAGSLLLVIVLVFIAVKLIYSVLVYRSSLANASESSKSNLSPSNVGSDNEDTDADYAEEEQSSQEEFTQSTPQQVYLDDDTQITSQTKDSEGNNQSSNS